MKRIFMWSGPRNLSTAMMYSFAQRADCVVVDEPFYANYLAATGLEHPMREDILAAQTQDESEVIAKLTAPLPAEKSLYYQKHMSHHLREDMRMDWLLSGVNVLLIRHPARVIASYAQKRERFSSEDLGFPQQVRIFDWLSQNHQAPLIVDSTDIRANPKAMLDKLCQAIGLEFDPAMLSWREGGIEADGIWAKHWYGAIHASSGFEQAEGALPQISTAHQEIFERTLGDYLKLEAHKLKPST